MFKKLFIKLALLLTVFQISALDFFPNEFVVVQHWFSFTTDFSVYTGKIKLGSVHRKYFTFSPLQYDFYDVNDQLQASARLRWFSWGSTFDVTDIDGEDLGRVEEKFSFFFPTFQIVSPENIIQAEASLNFWGTTYYIYDPNTLVHIAKMHRNFFRLKDDWTVTIVNKDLFIEREIDPRLFIIVMAFQTDRDTWKNQNNNNGQQMSLNFGGNENQQISDHSSFKELKALAKEQNLNNRLKALQSSLEHYRCYSTNEDPTPADVDAIVTLAEEKLNEHDCLANFNDDLERLENGFALLLPLFDDNTLSETQKNALFIMLEMRLRK